MRATVMEGWRIVNDFRQDGINTRDTPTCFILTFIQIFNADTAGDFLTALKRTLICF
jgi:hypothetical protein